MSKAIWKFPFSIEDEPRIPMPVGAEILHVACQADTPCIWALVDPAAPAKPRGFRLYGTGRPLPDDPGKHVGSFLMFGGSLVWHLFEPEFEKEPRE